MNRAAEVQPRKSRRGAVTAFAKVGIITERERERTANRFSGLEGQGNRLSRAMLTNTVNAWVRS